jgi:hypothetical protein
MTKNYTILYEKLKKWAENHGYHVYDHETILDYAGMNAEAAREKGLQHPLKDTDIYIMEYKKTKKDMFETLSHEIIERRKMYYSGWPYKKAHPYAERNQGNWNITTLPPMPVHERKRKAVKKDKPRRAVMLR